MELNPKPYFQSKIETIAKEQNAEKITGVSVRLGALAHISPQHFCEHFIDGVKGAIAEDAKLDVTISHDIHDPNAQQIILESVDAAY
ncbi:hydrogenase maturation nickel metallochaperone HypA [bacterium]|nr:hydrogenase maturation nickel metallochaperone HypA [FCB group bacterium]MBL7191276.1 hydrogenase maturation nickel metallochaperone HypA [bacterium]